MAAMVDDAWIDLFDTDLSDEDLEREANPDDTDLSTETSSLSSVDPCAGPPKKKRLTLLDKKQKQEVLRVLEELDEIQVSDYTSTYVMKQLHMQVYPERSQFFQLVTTTHKDTFQVVRI